MSEEIKIDERFMGINDKAEKMSEVFIGGERGDELWDIIFKMLDDGEDRHEADCPHNKNCRGAVPFTLAILKNYLIVHPELSEIERLAVVGGLFYGLGVRAGEANVRVPDGLQEILDKLTK